MEESWQQNSANNMTERLLDGKIGQQAEEASLFARWTVLNRRNKTRNEDEADQPTA